MAANPWFVASILSTSVGICLSLYKAFTSKSLKKNLALEFIFDSSNNCECCGLKNGRHEEKCFLKHPKPTDYREYFARRGNTFCSICISDILMGEYAARLPCLCTYHKACIDLWFTQKPTCPQHPYFGDI